MGDLKLYYPDGIATFDGTKDFVCFYSQVYFYAAGNTALEQEMDKLLDTKELTRGDIANILVWKTGGRLDQSAGVISSRRAGWCRPPPSTTRRVRKRPWSAIGRSSPCS